MSEEYAEIFREEATELLEELEHALLELEENPEDLTIVGRVFRAMHTIKGSGAMFGFDEIADFTHHVETALDKVREGQVPVTADLISLILASRDHISNLLDAASGTGEADSARGSEIVASLQSLMQGGSLPEATAGESEEAEQPEEAASLEENFLKAAKEAIEQTEEVMRESTPAGKLVHYRINFRPRTDFFSTGGEVDSILNDINALGEVTITGQSEGSNEQYASGEVEAFWDILLSTTRDENEIRDAFIFAESSSTVRITELGSEDDESFPEHQRLGDILLERGDISKDDLEQVLSEQKPLGEMLVAKEKITRQKVDSALNEQKTLAEKREVKSKASESIRVAADKLDHLINLVGEMVVTQARLTQAASGSEDQELLEPVEEVERLTSELRDCVLNIRMLPIGTTFSRFKRLVRDLSGELGKEVDLVMEGAETELDKSVIEQMGDPLVHLIRNSIDHGIETPEDRKAKGKPRKGTIKLTAAHSGANVIITVEDDGKGLDAEKIRKKAVDKGLIAADAELDESEVFRLIFGAGVSTASQVTEVSGRGVGMDVVKSTIEGRLKGQVKIDSVKGQGTTITISLPLTLAIIDGLLVKVGATHFVLPLSQVEECVELTVEDIKRYHGRHVFSVRDQLVPYVHLRKFFQIPGTMPDVQQMVVVNVNGNRVGLVLDDVIGGHQTVIKSLGWVYRNAEGVSGATILGNGEVALIVDVANLVRYAQHEEVAT